MKYYIAPQAKAIEIEEESLIAQSDVIMDFYPEYSDESIRDSDYNKGYEDGGSRQANNYRTTLWGD